MSSRDNRQWNYNPSKALRLTEIKAGRLNYELLNCAPGKNSLCKTPKRTHLNAGSCQNDSRSKNRGTITKKKHFQKLTSLAEPTQHHSRTIKLLSAKSHRKFPILAF